jgi:glutamine synthetase type III
VVSAALARWQAEVKCRESVMLDQYCNVVEMECLCMIDMIKHHVLPAALRVHSNPLK